MNRRVIIPIVILLLVPQSAPLVSMFMVGNLFRESRVVERLTNAAQNELLNLATIVHDAPSEKN